MSAVPPRSAPGHPRRGRPPGQMTPNRRKAMRYVLDCAAQRRPVRLREMVRVCDFPDRTSARRALRWLRNFDVDAI